MTNFLNSLLNAIKELARVLAYFVKNNLRTFSNILYAFLPYGMYALGMYEGKRAIVAGIAVPIIIFTIIFLLRGISNQLGSSSNIPVPTERFTSVDEDGEVTIETSRLQELILYTGELEDYLERKGLM